MKFKKAAVLITLIVLVVFLNTLAVSASSRLLKEGMESDVVKFLQKDLKELGYFDCEVTGYFGEITVNAVKNFQRDNGLVQDGIVGASTFDNINRILRPDNLLKDGMENLQVLMLQSDLKDLGFFEVEPTGYYGDITIEAVKKFQAYYGLAVDGIAGNSTFSLVDKLIGRGQSSVSRAATQKSDYLVPWFDGGNDIFKVGMTAKVYDVETGLSFTVKRTYGTNHADVEALTAKDTEIMKKIYGGSWSWARRAIVVTVGGRKIAASMNGMPHAGLEKYEPNVYVNSRAGDFGAGNNYDSVKGNNMDGHFCIHFLKSRTHGTNRVDDDHQRAVQKAAQWAADSGY